MQKCSTASRVDHSGPNGHKLSFFLPVPYHFLCFQEEILDEKHSGFCQPWQKQEFKGFSMVLQ